MTAAMPVLTLINPPFAFDGTASTEERQSINIRARLVGGEAGTPASVTVTPLCLKPNTAVAYGTVPEFIASVAYPVRIELVHPAVLAVAAPAAFRRTLIEGTAVEKPAFTLRGMDIARD